MTSPPIEVTDFRVCLKRRRQGAEHHPLHRLLASRLLALHIYEATREKENLFITLTFEAKLFRVAQYKEILKMASSNPFFLFLSFLLSSYIPF